MTYLVDTSMISHMMKNTPSLAGRVSAIQRAGDHIVYAVISHGEIYYGLHRMPSGERRTSLTRAVILILSALGDPVPVDASAAEHYAQIKGMLEKQGRPIPDNDLWIASVARSRSYILVTGDAHFNDITDLRVEDWGILE